MQFHGILAAPSPPLRDDTKVSGGQSPTRTDITFYVLVTLVDTMRLYGIQSPDPVALTYFSSIIRPLSIMVYAAKGAWLLKSWFCKWKCSATGDLRNLRFVQSERWPFMRSLRARFVSPTYCLPHWVHMTLGSKLIKYMFALLMFMSPYIYQKVGSTGFLLL